MSENDKSASADSDPGLEWAKLWQTMAESSNRMVEAWSGSMAPFMLARLSEKPGGFGDGNELSAAIERMAQGPRLADVWDIERFFSCDCSPRRAARLRSMNERQTILPPVECSCAAVV